MKAVTFLLYALFALFVSANDAGNDDQDPNKYYLQDLPGDTTYKDGLFVISGKCTRTCSSDCKDPKILEEKAKVGSRFAPRLAKVVVGECIFDDNYKGCGCRIPDSEACAKVFTCAENDESSSGHGEGKCRPKAILADAHDRRPCVCPKVCDSGNGVGRTRLLEPGRTRLSKPDDQVDRTRLSKPDDQTDRTRLSKPDNQADRTRLSKPDNQVDRTRLEQIERTRLDHVDSNANQLDRTRLLSTGGN